MPLFGTAFSIALESVEALAARSKPQAFAAYLLALAKLAEAAPSLPQDENEVTDFAQEIANDAHACLEKGTLGSTDRIKLAHLCLECWSNERNDNFYWLPDWLSGLALLKKERRAVLQWLEAHEGTAKVREFAAVWKSKV